MAPSSPAASLLPPPQPPPARRHLALWFPWLPAERALNAAAPPEGGAPFALVARAGNALRLAAVSGHAAGLGLVPGMALADARARHPALATQPHDPVADARALAGIARRLRRFTPRIAPDPPDGLILDITGCAHLFGGEEALCAAVRAATPFTMRQALAGHAPAARALARYGAAGQEDLATLPVRALELPDEALAGLRRAGLETVGALAARPAAAIAARFGAEAVVRLRRLLGEAAQPLDPLAHQAPLRFERRFAEPVGHQAAIARHLLALLGEAVRVLEQRGLGARQLLLTLCRSDGARQQLAIATSLPSRDPALILRLFDERIASLADPLDPGFGYDTMELAVPLAEPLGALQPGFEAPADQSAALAELVDRLATRLGPQHLARLVPRDSHLPERAQRLVPMADAPAPAPWPAPAADLPPRPLLLFDPPQPVEVIAEVPDGPPHRFRWRGMTHEVRLAEGPERLAAEWWCRPAGHLAGHGGLTRDYYRVEDGAGRRFWLFRHGLYDEAPVPRWYLHGLFA
ncbi:MAG: DNA polymerase Y family protein [Proteobacteria bacterium]|nr:DNA polymerase Y family protein [Pseudomonadota bacterium]